MAAKTETSREDKTAKTTSVEPPEKIDPVEEADQESFPASDAPAWTSGKSGKTKSSNKK